jgi:hypothetical protein
MLLLGASDLFVAPGGAPIALLIAVTTPIAAFLAAVRISASFREFVLGIDLRLITGIQAWRIGGFTFLALLVFGVLPGYFAWPAGLGDIAIGVTAPWILAALIRRPGFAASKTFVAWQAFGVLDLIVAVSLGSLGQRLLAATAGTAPLTHLPLVLIPTFFVPLFVVLHIAALFQARRFGGRVGGSA